MNNQAIRIQTVEIVKALGIDRRSAFEVSDLSPGVNVIYGPNGSGKSTIAKVIQELLWPGQTQIERPTIRGVLFEGDRKWTIDIDAGFVAVRDQTGQGDAPVTGPSESRNQYHLSLDGLLVEDDARFAKLIADASQGGYDLDGAAARLGLGTRRSMPRQLRETIENADKKLNAANRHQLEIQSDADQLARLRDQLAISESASLEVETLVRAMEYHRAKQRAKELQTALARFPEQLKLLHGNEREELDKLRDEAEQLEHRKQSIQFGLKRASVTLISTIDSFEKLTDTLLEQLSRRARRLADLERQLDQARHETAKANAELSEIEGHLPELEIDESVHKVERVEMERIRQLATRVHRANIRVEKLQEQLNPIAVDEAAASDLDKLELRRGISILSSWLAHPTSQTEATGWNRYLIWIAAASITVLAIALAVSAHWLWALAILAAAAMVVGHERMRTEKTESRAATYRRDYEETSLPSVDNWDAPSVRNRLAEFITIEQRLTQQDASRRERQNLQSMLEIATADREKLAREVDEAYERYRIDKEAPEEWLPVIVESLSRSLKLNAQARSLQAGVDATLDELHAVSKSTVDILEPFGTVGDTSVAGISGYIEELRKKKSIIDEAQRTHSDHQRQLDDEIAPRLAAVRSEIDSLLTRIQLDSEREPELDQWLGMLAEYRELQPEATGADAVTEEVRRALDHRPDLLEKSEIECQQAIDRARELAEKREELAKKVSRVEVEIERAKQGFELTDALTERANAIDELTQWRDALVENEIGALVTNWIKRNTLDSARPAVFRRAETMLTRITRGDVRLVMDDQSDPPQFRAQTGADPPRPIEQISVGERIQLLIAVRLAFMEQDEPTRLPLLLDETLGTSDDQRVGAIIRSMIDAAKGGRQVFYFTAQHDEVGKWIRQLDESNTPHKVIDLSEVRRLTNRHAPPLEIAALEPINVPSPNGRSYEDYGLALNVGGVDPFDADVGNLHLWHVFEDVNVLHSHLTEDINNWRQFSNLLESGGADLISATSTQRRRAQASAKAIETACKAWRIGRARPVDRELLLESGAVSATFIEEVVSLAEKCHGDAECLIDALRQQKVARWKQSKTDQLQAFFDEAGLIPNSERLSIPEIRHRVRSVLSSELNEGSIDRDRIDQIVARLPG